MRRSYTRKKNALRIKARAAFVLILSLASLAYIVALDPDTEESASNTESCIVTAPIMRNTWKG